MLQDALNERLLEVSMELHQLHAEKEWILERLDPKPSQKTAPNNKYTAPQATPKSCWNCFFFNSCYAPDEPGGNIKLCSKYEPA